MHLKSQSPYYVCSKIAIILKINLNNRPATVVELGLTAIGADTRWTFDLTPVSTSLSNGEVGRVKIHIFAILARPATGRGTGQAQEQFCSRSQTTGMPFGPPIQSLIGVDKGLPS